MTAAALCLPQLMETILWPRGFCLFRPILSGGQAIISPGLMSVSVALSRSVHLASGRRGRSEHVSQPDPPPTPWQRAQAGRRAARSERAGAKASGGRVQPASGSKWFAPGDFRGNGFLVEDKITEAASYRLSEEVFAKIEREAIRTPPGLLPCMRVTLGSGRIVRVVREDDFLYLCARLEDGNE